MRHILPLALALAGIGLGLSAQFAAAQTTPQGSIGLPPSVRDEAQAPATAKGKPTGTKKSAKAAASANASSGGAQARKTLEAPMPRRPASTADEPSSGGGLPRIQPSLDPSSGRMGFGGKF